MMEEKEGGRNKRVEHTTCTVLVRYCTDEEFREVERRFDEMFERMFGGDEEDG